MVRLNNFLNTFMCRPSSPRSALVIQFAFDFGTVMTITAFDVGG